MKKYLHILPAAALLAATAFPTASFAACTDLTVDLGQGSTDAATNGAVMKLQNFLRENDFLSATPNGVFGPATLSATKLYQVTSGISATGFVGPSTRASIKARSCSASEASAIPTAPASSNISISSPASGAALTIGASQTIRWKTAMKTAYSIILEDAAGVSVGYIAPSLIGNTTFSWKVGAVYSTDSQNEKTVEAGTYRIHIRDAFVGDDAGDPRSAFFTVKAQAIAANMVYPRTVDVSEEPAVVIYGSGFNSKSSIYVDGAFNIRTTKLYVSPDGRVIVINLPKDLSAGSHSLWAYNGTDASELGLNFTSI